MLNVTETIESRPPARQTRASMPTNRTPAAAPTMPAPTSLLDVILHAGSDPAFDVDKFRALVAIQREEQDRQDAREDKRAELAAEAAFNAAMADVQREMTTVRAMVENTQTRSVYADYAAMDRMLRPIYAPAGFALSYGEEDSPKADHVRVFCLVTHTERSGGFSVQRSHVRKYHVDMPADGKGARGGDVMTKTHATQSAFTYGQRGLLRLIFNIAVSKDDDGNAAGTTAAAAPPLPGCISAAQAQTIRALLDERGISHKAFAARIKLARIEDIGVEHFAKAVDLIKNVGRK
ncbi:ERF family protein [Bradyrhizobium genosp. L]|uniref:ERF family protein n=1 Tax=Bradyrhizobium genosp. L TaxID=83637 RepID=UPI0018A32DA6|nr:ERF family protein [Bradyrhizobium genosp. L]QPF81625.1 ERF family protein [Bradyrhizobium genosp. L]